MGVRIYLNDTLLEDLPIGWNEAKIKSKRDDSVKGLFLNYTTELTFFGDGFNFINDVMNGDYCEVINVLIQTDDCDEGNFVDEYIGVIQLTQIQKFDVDKRFIRTKVLDVSYNAKIDNNKSIKAFVDVGTSKNGLNITPAAAHQIEFFDPSAAWLTYLATTRTGYKIFDCFEFIVSYISDGTVDFKSDLLSNEYDNWMLFNGKEVRSGGGDGFSVEVSFKELFQQVNKKTNISFAIEPSDGVNDFRVRIEETAYFEQDNAILQLDNVSGIGMSFNKSEIYSNVEIGSASFEDDVNLTYPPIAFKTFKEENYTILGDCNVDRTLNLVSKYIIDTNIIEDSIVNNEDRYDKKIFLIVTDGSKAVKYKEYGALVAEGTNTLYLANKLVDVSSPFGSVTTNDFVTNLDTGLTAGVTAVTTNTLSLTADIFPVPSANYQVKAPPYNYNNPLTNFEVIGRFLGGLPNSVAKYLSTAATANFRATNTLWNNIAIPSTTFPFPYDDDSTPPNFDDGGNYDTTTGEYTVPASGLFGFEAQNMLHCSGVPALDLVTNGDFVSFLTGWSQTSAAGATGTILSEAPFPAVYRYYSIRLTASQSYLKQTLTIQPYTAYKVRFRARCEDPVYFSSPKPFNISANGSNSVHVGSSSWKSYEITLDYRNTPNPPQYLEFRFSNGGNVSLDNIELLEGFTYQITQQIVRSSAAGVVIQAFGNTEKVSLNANGNSTTKQFVTAETFSTFANEKIAVRLIVSQLAGGSGGQIVSRSYSGAYDTHFKTILTETGGGDILPTEPSDYPIYKYKFDKAISYSKFQELMNNPDKAVLFSNSEENHIFGWRNSIEYDRETGVASFELRSKTKIEPICQTE